MQPYIAHLEETCNYWLHIEKEEDMQTVLRTEGAGAPPTGTTAAAWPPGPGRPGRPG